MAAWPAHEAGGCKLWPARSVKARVLSVLPHRLRFSHGQSPSILKQTTLAGVGFSLAAPASPLRPCFSLSVCLSVHGLSVCLSFCKACLPACLSVCTVYFRQYLHSAVFTAVCPCGTVCQCVHSLIAWSVLRLCGLVYLPAQTVCVRTVCVARSIRCTVCVAARSVSVAWSIYPAVLRL